MRNSTRAFLAEALVPAYNAFQEYYGEREMGYRKDTANAAAISEALYNFPEHAFYDYEKLLSGRGIQFPKAYRSWLAQQDPSYELVTDFGNAWKHRRLDRKGSQLTSLDDVQENIAIVRYKDELGFYYASRKYIIVQLRNGKEVELGGAIKLAMSLVCNQMVELGVVSVLPTLVLKKPNFVSRKEVEIQPPLRWRIQRGEFCSAQPRAMIYQEGDGTITYGPPDGQFNVTMPFEIVVEKSWLEERS
jgi:hypothetical protein